MLNVKHGPYSVNSLLICAQAALLGGTVSNHDVINLLDVAQDLVSLTTYNSTRSRNSDFPSNMDDGHGEIQNRPEVALRIHLARENLGLSEANLARLLNTYSDHVSDWECGITEPPASMIIPLANALKCNPLWLLGDEGSIRQASADSEEQQHHRASLPTDAVSREALQQ